MQNNEPLAVFTTDPRYRLREKIALLIFIGGIGSAVLFRESLKLHFDRWRLHAGVNEWDALYNLSDQGARAVPYLEVYLHDADVDVRFRTVLCLKSMRDLTAVRALATALEDPDMLVRVNVIDAMAELRYRDAVPRIIQGISAEEPSVRRVAHRSLQYITGLSFDFDEYGGAEEQKRVVARWQAWWETDRSA